MQISDSFLTITQSATLLETTRQTVSRWVKAGRFNTQRIGREVLIPKHEVKNLVEEQLKHAEDLLDKF